MKKFTKKGLIWLLVLCLLGGVGAPAMNVQAAIKINKSKASITSVSCNKVKSATIKWKKVKNASGYYIYRATSKNGKYKKIKTVKGGSTLKFTNTGLKGGKNYYYKVRAYRKNGSKYSYSKYSTAKRVYVYTTKRGIIRKKVVDYYNKTWKPEGNYVCFDFDDFSTSSYYGFILRYQMSDEEAEDRINQGLSVYPNVYVMEVYVNKRTGKVTDEFGNSSWKMTLP